MAIGNHRLLDLENDQVTFRYRDTDTGQERKCTLPAEKFICRFLQYVLPKGFVKVRYYGIFSPGWRKRLVAIRRHLQGDFTVPGEEEAVETEVAPASEREILCPHCGRAVRLLRTLPVWSRCPP